MAGDLPSAATGSAAVSPGGGTPVDLTGRTLGDFQVLRRLGQGGMGEVYLAEQLSLKRRVALKILRTDLATNPAALQRFEAEARAVARFTHPNIVQVHATGQVDGLPYMALEYVEGRNLRDHIVRRGPPDLLQALSIMRQVASALQRASEEGIIHRDIKPENILLTRKGEVKVADFGLSRCLGAGQPALNLTQPGVTMGTPLFMSPEQVEGKELDARTDIYSFGLTCYYMLTGQPPFRGETALEVALKHLRAEPEPLGKVRPDLPEALCTLVHTMMAKDPAQRYQTGRALLKDLARLRESLSGQTVHLPVQDCDLDAAEDLAEEPAAATPPAGGPATPRRRPRRRLLAGTLTVALGLAAGAALAWLQRAPAAGDEPIPPADASVTEALPSLHRQEQALRSAADLYLTPDSLARNDPIGLSVCRNLALHYLDQHRLDEAEQVFTQLDQPRNAQPYRVLGHLGRAIVLALRDQPQESLLLFREIFAFDPRRPLPANPKRIEGNPAWLDVEFRYWIARALDHNAKNDVPPPTYLQKLREVPTRPKGRDDGKD